MAGSATIGSSGATLTINQSSNNAIINWQQFSIANGELTRFNLPTSSSATLNRVLGGNPSAIYGNLQSNGILYLLNPSGIVVGPTGRIDTAGFMASTLDVSNQQFLKGGNLNFTGASNASIDNEGTINASIGNVYLIANQVNNNGTLTAPQGNVGLAAGSDVLFQQAGNQHLFVQATPPGTTRATGVTNAGTILAAAAEIKAAGGNAYALAINNTGSIAATGFKKVNGQVYLTADGGNITNSGTISAQTATGNGGKIVLNGHGTSSSGTVLNSGSLLAKGRTGGTVEVLGNRVGITDQGVIDVSGDAGGGTALIGGDEHGGNPAIADADQTYLGPDATISANALTYGMGGKAILWGNQTTQVYGQISATGGALGGNGGFVETSAPSLDVRTTPNVSAPSGKGGTWLLDPSDVTISDTVSDNGFSSTPSAFTLSASGPYTISQSSLQSALQSGNVTIDASTGNGGSGTITWTQMSTDPMNVSNANGHTLTLDAPISLTVTGVTVDATGTGGLNVVLNSSLTGAGFVNVQSSTFNLNGGSFTANGNGYVSATDANGDANGVNLFNTTIKAAGGDITLTGNAGYVNQSGSIEGGLGVGIGSDGSTVVTLSTTGSGSISLTGTFNQNITSQTYFSAVDVYQDGSASNINNLSVANGTISIMGTVSQGMATGTGIDGVEIEQGSVLQATGTGSILLTGITSAATSFASGANSGFIHGVEVSGNLLVVGGSITINGMSGTVNTTNSTIAGSGSDTPFTGGVSVDNTAQITTGTNSTVTITGTGGAVVTTGAFTGDSQGVSFNNGTQLSMDTGGTVAITGTGGAVNAGNGANAGDAGTDGVHINGGISLATGGTIVITGFGGGLDTHLAAAVTGDNLSTSEGVSLNGGSDVAAAGNTTVTLVGTGGIVTAGSGLDGGSIGVSIGDDKTSPSLLTSVSGQIQITGIAHSAPGLGIGVVLHGFNLGSTTVESTTGNIIITGTGGSGYTGSGDILGNYIPNHGVALVDHVTVTTGGSITLTGQGGANSKGVVISELTNDTTLDVDPVLPVVAAGGAFVATALSGTAALSLDGTLNAASAAFTGDTMALGGSLTSTGTVIFDATGAITDTGSVQVGGFILQNGSWTQNSASLPVFTASDDFELLNSSTFLRVTGGNGTSNPFQITDIYGLQGLGSPSGSLLTANAELMNNIDATGTATWNSDAGFVPIGRYDGEDSSDSNTFHGTFNGQGHAINGLFINLPESSSGTGLFGDTATGSTLEDLNLTNVSVNGSTYVGGLAGVCNSTVVSVSSSGAINGTDYVGGLMGISSGAISDSYNAASVTGNESGYSIGGLDGYAQFGTITNCYSSGAVTAGESGAVGGLVGSNSGTISNSFWDTTTSGITSPTGGVGGGTNSGVTGATTTQLETQSYILANAPVTPTWDFTNVWTTNEDTTLPQLIGLAVVGTGTGGTGGGSSTPPSTTSGGADGGGSNLVPPAVDTPPPQPVPPGTPPPGSSGTIAGNLPPPPILSFTGNGPVGPSGPQDGGLADFSSSGGQVGAGDAASLGGGGLNNVNNPQAAGALNVALGPIVYHNLSDALKELGDWADVPPGPSVNDAGGNQETLLGPDQWGEMDNKTSKNIPSDQVPQQLKNALGGNVLSGVPAGAGH